MFLTPPEAPNDEDLKQLANGLRSYNLSYIGEHKPQKVGTFVKSDSGAVVGGAYGVINWGWLYIDWLWCDESIRGQGYGTKLVYGLEQFAKENGIFHVKLETTDFQALAFYHKAGYEVYGQLENYPLGHTVFYLKKDL